MSVSARPTRQERHEGQAQDKEALLKYRWSQAALAIYRDDNCCAVCWFLLGKRTVRSEVHHAFSRGKMAVDWREQYVNLLCVCRKHHPLPIQFPGANPRLAWVEDVLRQVNEKPINPRFQPPEDVRYE